MMITQEIRRKSIFDKTHLVFSKFLSILDDDDERPIAKTKSGGARLALHNPEFLHLEVHKPRMSKRLSKRAPTKF